MSDYISRESAEKIFSSSKENWKDYEAGACIAALPAADVRENTKGRWEAVHGVLHPAETSAVCSNCGFATMIHAMGDYNFCPKCGANMRGK